MEGTVPPFDPITGSGVILHEKGNLVCSVYILLNYMHR